VAIRVRDRLGDYGTSGLVALDRADHRWTVDVFSLSCPVLGKGVEAAVLREVTRRAGAAGADEVVVRWTDTGRNGTARRFLSEVDAVAPGDPRVRLRATPASDEQSTGVRR
jgi:predicted enzyme involved in methoxymalonyl-ACP biosynthesis